MLVLSDETPAEVPKAKPPKVKGVGFGNIFAGGEVKLRKTGGNSTADHSKTPPAARSSELAQKRVRERQLGLAVVKPHTSRYLGLCRG